MEHRHFTTTTTAHRRERLWYETQGEVEQRLPCLFQRGAVWNSVHDGIELPCALGCKLKALGD